MNDITPIAITFDSLENADEVHYPDDCSFATAPEYVARYAPAALLGLFVTVNYRHSLLLIFPTSAAAVAFKLEWGELFDFEEVER